ncbi:MAG: MlaD family protein [Candidatus Symbiothrix sp.]|jgi:phospholipid/cholesterol/gamma-HCH transport system substrate-binding protein|nr:MlaD family protein [Candidatus Symbiothrix sp.]
MRKLFTKEVSIALITIVSLVILYLGINHLKGINVFHPANHYYIAISDVSELQVSSPVQTDGFKIGIVHAIHYNYDHPDKFIVEVGLDEAMKVQTGSYAELKSNLTSGAYLDLKLNKYVSNYYTKGDTIEGVVNAGLMEKLSDTILPQIEQVLPRLDSILMGIQALVNHPALNQTLNNLETTTSALERSSQQLNVLLANDIPHIVANLDQVSSDFSVVSQNLKGIDFQQTFAAIDQTMRHLESFSEQLRNPNSSLGLLMNDRTFYDHLDSAVVNASNLLLDINERPKRYLRLSLF